MQARIACGKNACKLKVDRHNKKSGFCHNLSYAVPLTIRIITIKDDICKTNRSTPEKTGIEKITQKIIFAMFICTETRKKPIENTKCKYSRWGNLYSRYPN